MMTNRFHLPSITAAALLMSVATAPAALAADWTVNYDESTLGFRGTQAGAPFTGSFGEWEASVSFDPADPSAAAISVTIVTETASSGSSQRDGSIADTEWFNSREFPTASFVSETVRNVGGDAYEADGTLTIRDNALPVTLPFTLTVNGDTATAAGELTIDRRDYDVGTGDWASGSIVGTDVTILVELTATR